MEPSRTRKFAYPAPVIVVGVGEFGLQVLERVGDDWAQLQLVGDDPTLANLRLVLVQSGAEDSTCWRAQEAASAAIAEHVGDGDLPTRALDFCILRSLGLIRFWDGEYQIGVPRDIGPVRVPIQGGGEGVFRDRFFDWERLSTDPLVAIEALYALRNERPLLDVFLAPILTRTLHGQSPSTLLRCVSRCRAWRQGRDPWPWPHYRDRVSTGRPGTITASELEEANTDELRRRSEERGETYRFYEDPLAGQPQSTGSSLERTETDSERDRAFTFAPPGAPSTTSPATGRRLRRAAEELRVPPHCLAEDSDLPSPINTSDLLDTDWETTGRGYDDGDGYRGHDFSSLPRSPQWLGLVDSDRRHVVSADGTKILQDRLREHLRRLGALAHKGLARLWTDIQRNRDVILKDGLQEHEMTPAGAEYAQRQSLELLGELLVRPLLRTTPRGWCKPSETRPPGPSRRLENLSLDSLGRADESPLRRHLVRLGLREASGTDDDGRPLLRTVEVPPVGRELTQAADLRLVVNEIVRDLLDIASLREHRTSATRRAPRVTVLVVGDVGEAFVRATTRVVLREIHAELLRAFGPILDSFRAGIDRPLTIVPIVWTPHPADPFGEHPELRVDDERRVDVKAALGEAAVIIESIQGLRRWVESIPAGKRCIPHIYVNGRVTDRSVLKQEEAVRQTHDFINLLSRHEVEREELTRVALTGQGDSDVFSTFSCYEIGFQERRAVEYLATRAVEDALRGVLQGVPHEEPEPSTEEEAELELPDLAAGHDAREKLREQLDRIAERLAESFAIAPPRESSRADQKRRFSDDALDQLVGEIQQLWSRLIEDEEGTIDRMVDDLRVKNSRRLATAIDAAKKEADTQIQRDAGELALGLDRSIARLRRRARQWKRIVDSSESDREQIMTRAVDASIPRPRPQLAGPFASVRNSFEGMANRGPMRWGGWLFTAFGVGFGASVLHFLALAFGLHERRMQPSEPLLSALFVLLAGLVAWSFSRWYLRRGLERQLRAVGRAVSDLVASIRNTVVSVHSGSISAFFDSRLDLASTMAQHRYAVSVGRQFDLDERTADRIRRSVEVQKVRLLRHKEELGCRTGFGQDDVGGLFSSAVGLDGDTLIDPVSLLDYYDDRHRNRGAASKSLQAFIEAGGGFSGWRTRACFSDTNRLLAHGRRDLAPGLLEQPVVRHSMFKETVERNLDAFVRRTYPNIGFPAKFKGYEGLDPSGIHVAADAQLAAHPELIDAFEQRITASGERWTATFETIECESFGNTAYMISMAVGIRPQSLHNLQRFESFHERPDLPSASIFPMSGEGEREGNTLTSLTAFEHDSTAFHERRIGASPVAEERARG